VGVVLGWYPAPFENGVIDVEIFLPHLPQDQRSGIDPYLDTPPSTGLGPVTSVPFLGGADRPADIRADEEI
jgi:hypothetical protein